MGNRETAVPGVYTLTNTVSGRVYVGASRNMQHRWAIHRSELKTGANGNPDLQKDWDVHGAGAFVFAVWRDLSNIPKDELRDRLHEAEYAALQAFPHHYNLALLILPRGSRHSVQTKAKIAASWADPEIRAKKVAGMLKAAATKKTKRRRGAAQKKRWRDPEQYAKQMKLIERLAAPEYRAIAAKRTAELWADPEHRAKRIAALRAGWARKRAAAQT